MYKTSIQHYTLRLFLWRTTPAPLNLVRWLEEARTRGLLVRVGGGYRFYHRLLQEHLAAATETTKPPEDQNNDAAVSATDVEYSCDHADHDDRSDGRDH